LIAKKFVTGAYANDFYSCAKSVHERLQVKQVKYNTKFLFIPFLSNSPTGQTTRQIFTLDGSNDADSCKGVPLLANR